ncbi:MAG: hypothetical protein LJE69_06390 [Thiohalocapsa sp.]|jgi:hypothetical protein|uniref:hypothetical protein n=1 Tax=Thiohalocapsa sp. TaxID=2497641 RepID=UPI0025F1DC32|nr:hypothetical protein [Thiohalocapsa sp.]MCG6940860.1 hypothetical protein [Thiohalocapsa sp.]
MPERSIPDSTDTERWLIECLYEPGKQVGTGVHAYDDLAECAVSLLQAQADHVAQDRSDLPQSKQRISN